MTKEEAYKIVENIDYSRLWTRNLVDMLEKLGVIKLESPEDIAKNDLLAHLSTSYSFTTAEDIVRFIERGGFKVIKAQQEN